MKSHRLVFALVFLGIAGALFVALGSTAPTVRAQNPAAPDACPTPIKKGWLIRGNCGTTAGTHFVGTTDNQALVFKTNNGERMRIDPAGHVGIGMANPGNVLDVQGSVNTFNGVALGLYNSNAGNTNKWALGTGGAVVVKDAFSIGDTSSNKMTILSNGNVGIGTTTPPATLAIKGPDTSSGTLAFRVSDSTGLDLFSIYDAGFVSVRKLVTSTSTGHVCRDTGYLSTCGSAAEYVPTIDSGLGFPDTADVVSVAPDAQNPYGDAHSPFVVQKSTTPCDTNLLGFIVKPESGADGVKKNDHYLPLAIYGYFPAKVSMENGFIHRGDPLTSSSKPGYAMKATGACKIIGYALEDANADGAIQVFANTGESTAPEVAALRGQVDALTQENESLKQTLAVMDARLKALEQTSSVASNALGQAR